MQRLGNAANVALDCIKVGNWRRPRESLDQPLVISSGSPVQLCSGSHVYTTIMDGGRDNLTGKLEDDQAQEESGYFFFKIAITRCYYSLVQCVATAAPQKSIQE